LGGGVKMHFVLVQPGFFQMGSANGFAREKPVHTVTITRPFYLSACKVTQEQWQAIMGTDWSSFKGPKNPVDSVSWDDCQTFLRKLSEKLGGGFRLPTEAEWEYACRAGSTTAYCYGDDEARLGDYAWFAGNSGGATHPVALKKPNAWGLYDVHGTVWEWCQDWYGPYADGAVTDPRGPDAGDYRVLRGGSWRFDARHARSAFRTGIAPASGLNGYAGLRVARTLE
jgi:formylglycine-generating enzyme required for sulfatase activity